MYVSLGTRLGFEIGYSYTTTEACTLHETSSITIYINSIDLGYNAVHVGNSHGVKVFPTVAFAN